MLSLAISRSALASRRPTLLVFATSTPSSSILRPLSTSSKSLDRSSFTRPGPPPLPAADQAEFDALLKANATIGASPEIVTNPEKGIKATEEQHKDVRRGPKPEFEGDVNPKTGERGGPKNDPFIAGDQDWQFGGRVTDF
ncbi:hypothetical protein I317_03476 [Kwoniella heveanensis CBS 569]|nr:hypothetical protein I317_03476 [Kwoniella heveanensis CBS 569]